MSINVLSKLSCHLFPIHEASDGKGNNDAIIYLSSGCLQNVPERNLRMQYAEGQTTTNVNIHLSQTSFGLFS